MYRFQELLKKIRQEAGITQAELADILDVSTVLISMIETGQKEASKAFVTNLGIRMGVSPSSIMPFVLKEDESTSRLSKIEKQLLALRGKLQDELIKKRAKNLTKG